MRCHKTGRKVLLRSAGEPYQLWSGDEFKCPTCGLRAVTQFGRSCLERGVDEPGFTKLLEIERLAGNVVEVEG
jgi:hypothetical protein